MSDIKLTVEEWAEIVVKIWEEKMLQLEISDTFQLANSFAFHVIGNAGGDVQRIEFAFNYYGKFVDMGVGRGIKLEDRYFGSKRISKPWYTKTFMREVRKLKFILAEKYGHLGAISIVENIDDNALKWHSKNF